MTRTAAFLLLGIVALSSCSMKPVAQPPPNPTPVWTQVSDQIRISVVQTGWVAVKSRFRDLSGPAALRLPAIVLDRSWTEWLPIQFYVVDHPEGTMIFDTGETADVALDDYFRCNSATNWFYRNQLRFAVEKEDELPAQLELLGVGTDDINKVILSHLHSDHIGGLRHVTQAQWLISAIDAHGHAGALMCRIPDHDRTQYVRFDSEPFGGFQQSFSVNTAGDIRVVPTPGHTRGHQSLMIDIGERFVLLAGDVVFDRRRLESGRAMAGIVEDIKAAKRSIEALDTQISRFPTSVLAAHDINAVKQLEEFHGSGRDTLEQVPPDSDSR